MPVAIGNGFPQSVDCQTRTVQVVLRQAAQLGFHVLRGNFQGILQRAVAGEFTHGAGAGDGEGAPAGHVPDIADPFAVHFEGDLDGVPALADPDGMAGRLLDNP